MEASESGFSKFLIFPSVFSSTNIFTFSTRPAESALLSNNALKNAVNTKDWNSNKAEAKGTKKRGSKSKIEIQKKVLSRKTNNIDRNSFDLWNFNALVCLHDIFHLLEVICNSFLVLLLHFNPLANDHCIGTPQHIIPSWSSCRGLMHWQPPIIYSFSGSTFGQWSFRLWHLPKSLWGCHFRRQCGQWSSFRLWHLAISLWGCHSCKMVLSFDFAADQINDKFHWNVHLSSAPKAAGNECWRMEIPKADKNSFKVLP